MAETEKRWGWVSARPSEFLVHVRNGVVRERSSGQGATCFKRPLDAVAIVPTSLQRLTFRADQVTRERVGVEVVGLAVYRIGAPLVAYRVLSFSEPALALERLEATLTAMCVGGTRRLVANLAIDECLEKRKSALAEELLREIAPVVGGEAEGAGGWGVVVDSIEIQEVRVLSDRVFDAMQAPFRADLDQRARTARADAERVVATRESTCEREIEEARIADELAVAERREALRRAEAEGAQRRRLEVLAHQAEEAQAGLDVVELRTRAARAQAGLEEAGWAAQHGLRRAEAEVSVLEGEAAARVALANARARQEAAAAEATLRVAEGLPALAGALAQPIEELRVVQLGGAGESPTAAVVQGVASLVELARGLGATVRSPGPPSASDRPAT